MAKKKKIPNRVTFSKGALRRASLGWPPISECRRLARVGRGEYLCAMCKGIFKDKECHVDHRDPVIDIIKGFTTWDDYINRLFCDVEGLDLLCKNCHESKTSHETHMRKWARAKRKEEASEHDEDEEN